MAGRWVCGDEGIDLTRCIKPRFSISYAASPDSSARESNIRSMKSTRTQTAGELDRQMVAQCVPVDERVDREAARVSCHVCVRCPSKHQKASPGRGCPQGYASSRLTFAPVCLIPSTMLPIVRGMNCALSPVSGRINVAASTAELNAPDAFVNVV